MTQKFFLPQFDKNISTAKFLPGKLEELEHQPFIVIGAKTVPYRLLKGVLNSLLKYPQNSTKFPGNLPVSLMRSDIATLFHGPTTYAVLEKTDGVRYLMFFLLFKNQPTVLLVDRGFNFQLVVDLIVFPRLYLGTILDVEYVVQENDQKKPYHTFWVFDVLAFCGESYIHDPRVHYINRTQVANIIVKHFLRAPRGMAFKCKELWPMSDFRKFVEKILPKRQILTPIDGLIFVPLENAYVEGQDATIFKWKKGNDHTVDFTARLPHSAPSTIPPSSEQLRLSSECVPIELWVDNSPKQPLEFYTRTSLDLSQLPNLGCKHILDLDQRIVECRLMESKHWQLVKIRRDRKTPNHKNTVLKTEQNIVENITFSEFYCQCADCHVSEK